MPMPRIKRSPMSHQILGAKAQPIAQAPAPEPQPHKYVCGRPYRDLAEQQRTNRRSQQGSGIHQAFLEFARVPYWFYQRHYYANDEEIVGVGKESHPRNKHDLPMLAGDFCIVHFGEVGDGGRFHSGFRHRTSFQLRVGWPDHRKGFVNRLLKVKADKKARIVQCKRSRLESQFPRLPHF
jgi:hypothetical protein